MILPQNSVESAAYGKIGFDEWEAAERACDGKIGSVRGQSGRTRLTARFFSTKGKRARRTDEDRHGLCFEGKSGDDA